MVARFHTVRVEVDRVKHLEWTLAGEKLSRERRELQLAMLGLALSSTMVIQGVEGATVDADMIAAMAEAGFVLKAA